MSNRGVYQHENAYTSMLYYAGGQLLVIAEVAGEERSFENGPPWLLTPEHVGSFESCGLEVQGKVIEEGLLKEGDDIIVTTFARAGT